jgi:hypothetical protein
MWIKAGRSSFLKKRSKKLLRFWFGVCCSSELKRQKFFASFFQKRSPFFLPGPGLRAARAARNDGSV